MYADATSKHLTFWVYFADSFLFSVAFNACTMAKVFISSVQYLNSQQHKLVRILFAFCLSSTLLPLLLFFWLFDLDNCFDPIICSRYTYIFECFLSLFKFESNRPLWQYTHDGIEYSLLAVCVCVRARVSFSF